MKTPEQARVIRDAIKEYGKNLDDADYDTLYDFGIWFADQAGAQDVLLSDWSPHEKLYDHSGID